MLSWWHHLMTLLPLPSAALQEDVTTVRDPNQPTFSLWHCVLWLPGQKARPIFTYHFDTILGCNWNWALGVEILTQNTKHWRALGGWTLGGLLPEASWQGWLWFLGVAMWPTGGYFQRERFSVFSVAMGHGKHCHVLPSLHYLMNMWVDCSVV